MREQEQAGLVLIVEDNRNISEMVGEYLESRGFEIDYAADGLDGYRLASENVYDAIVLDLMLPRRLAGTISRYSKNAIPQLARMTLGRAVSRYFRCPYQAKVMNTLDSTSRNGGSRRA